MPRDIELETREVISAVTLTPQALDASPDASLADVGIDSVGMIDLVYRLEEHFGVTIGDDDVSPETFASIASVVQLITRKCA